MKTTNKADAQFNVTDKFKKRALELLDESQAMQFAEGLRLNRSASVVFAREAKRLTAKYGANDPRTVEMAVRFEASETVKADLFARYVDVMTPPTTAKEGWAVDGFVRAADGVPVGELTVAVCDKEATPIRAFGSATTDGRGFFSMKLDKLPENPPEDVFMRAFKGRTVLESKEVRLVPENGATERVEIILSERFGGGKPPEPTQPGTGTATPPDRPVVVTTDKPPTGATPTPDKPVATGATPTTGTSKPPATEVATPKPSTTPKPVVVTGTPAVVLKPKKVSTATASKPKSAKSKTTKAKATKPTKTSTKSRSTASSKTTASSGKKNAPKKSSSTRASKKKR